ncbi:MAG: alpha/beta fold hydrolase [Gammaproteobacteria bacterium]|nr:alpha/beta fold hydrolase [Gammaproteobacteria bacterium]
MNRPAPAGATPSAAPSVYDPAREQACFFANPAGEQLYAVMHAVGAGATARPGILFCAPLSEERHYGQRVIVEYARTLAERGYATLRFDPAGCGDSAGEMQAVTLSTLVRDTRAAISQLMAATGVPGVVLIGVRFGAIVARLAADADERVTGLALIAPIVSGASYWQALLRSQQMSCMTRGLKAPKIEDLYHTLAADGRVEIKGECFGREFGEQLAAVDLRTAPARARAAVLLAPAADEPVDGGVTSQLLAALQTAGISATTTAAPVDVFWSSKALYQGCRPQTLYAATLAWLAGLAA